MLRDTSIRRTQCPTRSTTWHPSDFPKRSQPRFSTAPRSKLPRQCYQSAHSTLKVASSRQVIREGPFTFRRLLKRSRSTSRPRNWWSGRGREKRSLSKASCHRVAINIEDVKRGRWRFFLRFNCSHISLSL